MGDVITYCAITTLYSNLVAPSLQGQVMGASFILVSIVWALTALIGGLLIAMNSILLSFCFIGRGNINHSIFNARNICCRT